MLKRAIAMSLEVEDGLRLSMQSETGEPKHEAEAWKILLCQKLIDAVYSS